MKPLRLAPLEIRDHNSEFEINLTINTCQTHNNSYTTDGWAFDQGYITV